MKKNFLNKKKNHAIAIILSGGEGKRLATSEEAKQYLKLEGIPIILYSVAVFAKHPLIDFIVIVLKEGNKSPRKKIFDTYQTHKKILFTDSGPTRQDSSYQGLSFIADRHPESSLVAIHDSARPFITKDIITQGIDHSQKNGAAQPITPIRDSVIHKEQNLLSYPDRKSLFAVQTPQFFQFSLIWNAHQKAKHNQSCFNDDSSLLLAEGKKIHLFTGSHLNYKITDPQDLNDAKILARSFFSS